MKPYSVLLLYPDYLTDTFGQETYLAHVGADTPEQAVIAARKEVIAIDTNEKDFFVLLVIEGHHEDRTP